MPSTYVSLYYHIVFSTKLRRARIRELWQERLYSYLGGVLRGLKAVSEGAGGTEDHVHILASLRAAHCLAEVVRDLKSSSSKVWRSQRLWGVAPRIAPMDPKRAEGPPHWEFETTYAVGACPAQRGTTGTPSLH